MLMSIKNALDLQDVKDNIYQDEKDRKMNERWVLNYDPAPG